jgi:hypothetical protein
VKTISWAIPLASATFICMPGGSACAEGLTLASDGASRFTPGEAVFGSLALPGHGLAGFDTNDPVRGGRWIDASATRAPSYTVGYTWKQLSVERAAFTHADHDIRPGTDPLRPDSSATRLSYHPVPGWSFQLIRGNLGGVDQVNTEGEIRRTSISATYSQSLRRSDWQTTFAWGRSVRANHEPSMGYLVESSAHFDGKDALFGRLEQVRSDELLRQNDSIQRNMFKLKKLTVGYYRNLQTGGPVAIDIGIFASRYLVPSQATLSYGREPTAYMLFLRASVR